MGTYASRLAAWRARPSDAAADALDVLDATLAEPLPELLGADALAQWHAVARTGDPAQLGRLLEPLVATLELAPPSDETQRETWRKAMSEAVQALFPFLPDPRLSFALACMVRRTDSSDLFHPDEAAHLVATAPQPAPTGRSLGTVLVEALSRTADPRVPDWLHQLTVRMTEVDCNGAQLRDDLIALEATLRAAGAPGTTAAPAEAMPSALRRRIDLGRSTAERVRLRPGATLTPGAWAGRGPDLLAWPGWARVTELELPGFLSAETLLDRRLEALSGVFGLDDWDAAALLHRPRPLQTLAVRAPSMARDDDDEPMPEPPLDDAPLPEASADADANADIPIEAYALDEPVEAEWIDAGGADAAFEAMAASSAFETEAGPEPEPDFATEPDPFETMAEAILRGRTLPGLETLRVSLHAGGRHGTPRAERFRWLWQRRLGQQLQTFGVVAVDAAQVRGWWDEAERLPPSIRCVELFEQEPVVASPDGFVIAFTRDDAGPFTRWAVRGPSASSARMAAHLPQEAS